MGGEPLLADSGAPPRTHLELFAAVLLARPMESPDERVSSLASWAGDEAFRAIARGRAPTQTGRSLSLKLLYGALRPDAAGAKPSHTPDPAAPRWERALLAVATLRHRQRAVLTARYVLGLDDEETAAVVGVRPREARAIADAGIAAALRTAGGPLDIRRALRTAGARLIAQGSRDSVAEAPPRMPRPVVRRLVAPPAPAIPREPCVPASVPVIDLVLAAAEAEPPDIVPPPPGDSAPVAGSSAAPAGRRRHRSGRLALAAGLAVLLVAAIAPAAPPEHGVPPPAVLGATWTAPRTTVSIASDQATSTRRTVVVRPGDTLWAIARRTLGDARRWEDVWRWNRGRVMRPGERFGDPDLIRPGWRLMLERP